MGDEETKVAKRERRCAIFITLSFLDSSCFNP